MFTSIGLAGWSGANTTMWWCTARTIEITLINLLGKRERLERNNMVVSVGLVLKRIKTYKSIRLAGGGGAANATTWWFMLVYCYSHLNHLHQFAWLGGAVRTQQRDGSCWSIAKAIWTIYINLLGWGKRCERNNVMVHVGVLHGMVRATWTIKINLLGWWKRFENNGVMKYVGTLLEPLKTYKSIYLGMESGVTATMCWNI